VAKDVDCFIFYLGEGVGCRHFVERFPDGDRANTCSCFVDGNEGTGKKEFTAAVVQLAVADELD
jgi:hypothetical protein